MIDPHVHLRDWNQKHKETIAHGFTIAAGAGIRALYEMPNTDPTLTDYQRIKERVDYAGEEIGKADVSGPCEIHTPVKGMIQAKEGGYVGYGLYGGVTADPKRLDELLRAHQELFPFVIGFKMFAGHSTGNMGLTTLEEQKLVYRHLAEGGYTGLLAVHCEKESFLRPELWERDEPLGSHFASRPPDAELESVVDQLESALDAGFTGTLHICHVSLPETILIIEGFREQMNPPFRITAGVTPHHTRLYIENAFEAGIFTRVNPPIRLGRSALGLYRMLIDGRIDWIETDHAPHTILEKQRGACGLPGFGGYAILVRDLMENGVSPEHLASITGGAFAAAAGLAPEISGGVPTHEQNESSIDAASFSCGWNIWEMI